MLLGNSHSDSIKNVFADIAVQHGFNTYLFAVNYPMTREILPPEAIIQETLRRHAKWIFIHYKVDTLNPNKLNRLAEIAAKHQIRLSLIMPVPVYEHGNYYYKSIPATLYYGRSSHITEQDYLKRNQALIQQAKQLEARYPNFQTLPVVQTFCTPVCQISTADKRPYYFDDDHLTLTGSQLMVPVIRQAFESSR
ncbi:SGNH hydrolase domain-containing protein [Acinetobacter soli]|nr:SGNH hydrolase domain-containing protein [Acinetobacter soli]WEI01403.1 SGNH hydrolase domain-containing protein [Acinetobacter soli]